MKRKTDTSFLEEAPELAQKLRYYRKQAGFSQQNVADILNVSRSTYTYYETGKTTPDPSTLNRIARMFGVPITEFFSDEYEGPRQFQRMRDPKAPPILRTYSRHTPMPDPTRVGELSADEKAMIAYIRDRNVSPKKVMEMLSKQYDLPEKPKVY